MFSRVFYCLPGAADWMPFGGRVDLASSVHCVVAGSDALFIGTGHVYGNVYTCSFDRLTAVEESVQERPRIVVVNPSYPNPFNPATVVSYFLPDQGPVRLDIYDVAGSSALSSNPGPHRLAGTSPDGTAMTKTEDRSRPVFISTSCRLGAW